MAGPLVAFGQGLHTERASYKNLQLLGGGRNADTFLVMATSGEYKGILFALKVLRNFDRPERPAMFLEETRALRECEHPAVMRLFDTGMYRGRYPFLVAEFLPKTLREVIAAGAATTVEKLSCVLQLLSALAYLERMGFVHRDLKPENVFLKGTTCVLGDFGLLKRLGGKDEGMRAAEKSSPGWGMPFRYRTPDQVAYFQGSAPLTPRSDVFQLGLVAAELLVGENPERSPPTGEYLAPIDLDLGILERLPPSLKTVVPGLIGSMLDLDWERRPSAAKLLNPWQGVFLDAARAANAQDGYILKAR
jgi:serine/threonine protein kinase